MDEERKEGVAGSGDGSVEKARDVTKEGIAEPKGVIGKNSEEKIRVQDGLDFKGKVSVPSAWIKAKVDILEVEDGIFIKVRRPKLEMLFQKGVLPKGLISKVMTMGETFDKLSAVKTDINKIQKEDIFGLLSEEEFYGLMEILDVYACITCIDPKVFDPKKEPKYSGIPNNIDVGDIPLSHKVKILLYATEGGALEYVDFFGQRNT